MKTELLEILRCPKSGKKLIFKSDESNDTNDKGLLISDDMKFQYKVINSIPRFVNQLNYADNFGLQWNKFSKTQLDSYSGHPISAERFWKATGWRKSELRNKWVLDIGCGSGRFAEIALQAGAKVIALDYSNSVDAALNNLKHFPNFYVVQGDIFSLPFLKNSFDFVYCLGVLQHTPNVQKALKVLPPMLSKNGKLCVDVYWKRFRTMMHSKYLVRPITKRIPNIILFKIIEKIVPWILPLSIFLSLFPFIGVALKRILPIANYYNIYPLSRDQLIEWAVLDTFDMLSPEFDSPLTKNMLHKYMKETGLKNIEILHATLLAARGVKK